MKSLVGKENQVTYFINYHHNRREDDRLMSICIILHWIEFQQDLFRN